jgi:ribosome maturation factor RimP
MDIKQRATEIILEHLPADHYIVDVSFKPSYKTQKLSVILDGEQGVSIDVCALISRKLGYFLEEENAIEEAYNLEVSSPGVDAPFTDIRQYRRNVGREVKVQWKGGIAKTGLLEEVIGEEAFVFQEILKAGEKGRKPKMAKEKETITIKDILKINVVLTF